MMSRAARLSITLRLEQSLVRLVDHCSRIAERMGRVCAATCACPLCRAGRLVDDASPRLPYALYEALRALLAMLPACQCMKPGCTPCACREAKRVWHLVRKGRTPQPRRVRMRPGDTCKRGHAIKSPDDLCPSGCRFCRRQLNSKQKARYRSLNLKPWPKGMCRSGQHAMTPENVNKRGCCIACIKTTRAVRDAKNAEHRRELGRAWKAAHRAKLQQIASPANAATTPPANATTAGECAA